VLLLHSTLPRCGLCVTLGTVDEAKEKTLSCRKKKLQCTGVVDESTTKLSRFTIDRNSQ